MRINYNSWFYEQHRYLQGSKDGFTSYNDTKWNNINERMKTLIELQSQLNSEQPYSVVANYVGMNKLIGLLDKTDYTFQDVDESLVATYKRSLKNAMSSMAVNTHAVIAKGKSTDKNIIQDPHNTNYYVIDVLYQQLHFGDRDEVIRQQLQNMFASARNNYLTPSDLMNPSMLNLMGFALICTCNGLICHDWQVGLDDKGFHFRIKWTEPYDAEFIIYKLDKTIIATTTTTRRALEKTQTIKVSGIPVGTKCIVDIYDSSINDNAAPNFGIVTDTGVTVSALQFTNITRGRSDTLTMNVVVYGIKYLYEVPNVYPSVNYYDMMREQSVYTNDGVVCTDTGDVIGRVQNMSADTLCTPPISIDRPVIDSFDTIIACVKMRSRMSKHRGKFNLISTRTTVQDPVEICREQKAYMESELVLYKRGAILTSWVSAYNIEYFQGVIDRMQAFIDSPGNGFAEANPSKFNAMVDRICAPFERDSMKLFMDMNQSELSRNYFDEDIDLATRINRPISEQCIIAMKYNSDDGCWVFTAPDIKHFHGIGNAFYIDTGLEFGEAYKFFFLYTDTDAPGETNVEQMSFDTVFDYDKFESEIDKHLGYIRYWNVENHLRKLSRIMYSDDSTEIQNQVLSEILRRKFEGAEFLDTYPSDMNYESSNASSDNIHAGEFDDRAPFAVNFMFYTVSMMFDQSDKMLTYFLSRLNKSNNRYDDIPIPIDEVEYMATVDLSQNHIISNTPDTTHSLKDGKIHMYYGYPGVIGTDGETMTLGNTSISGFDPYNITYHNEPENRYPLITDEGIDENYYITAESTGVDVHEQIYCVQLCSQYTQRALDAFGYIMHYNTTPWARSNVIEQYYTRLVEKRNEISGHWEHCETYIVPQYVLSSMDSINSEIKDIADAINALKYPGFPKSRDWFTYVNMFIGTLQSVYTNVGFIDEAKYRVNALYEHLSKINSGLALYDFRQWIEDIDIEILDTLDSQVIYNASAKRAIGLSSTYFKTIHDELAAAITASKSLWDDLHDKYVSFENMFNSVTYNISYEYMYNGLMTWLKDNYTIDSIDFEEFVLDTKPEYICVMFNLKYEQQYDYYSTPDGNVLVFKPVVIEKQDGFHVVDLRPITEYTLYSNDEGETSFNSYYVIPMDETGNQITYTGNAITLNIKRISIVGDTIPQTRLLPNTSDTSLDFQNIHNTHEIVDGNVVDVNYAATNYELIASAKFVPLKHDTETILDRETFEPKPIDRVRISNWDINSAVRDNLCYHDQPCGYLKPVHVMISLTDYQGLLGRYEVGDTICFRANPSPFYHGIIDLKYVFSAKVVAITHSDSHACIEAAIDNEFTQWKQISLHDFVYWLSRETPLYIECEILDDNFRNFMDEFNNSDYSYYQIPELPQGQVTPETLPGDPLFVSEYSDYVYTRLNWFFGPNVPNRFPNDEQKTWDFVYVGTGSFIPDEGMTVRLLNHNWNTMDLSEMYPVLKNNNGEHTIRDLEIKTFEEKVAEAEDGIRGDRIILQGLIVSYSDAKTESERQLLKIAIEERELKIKNKQDLIDRLTDCINQPEVPTTWYNLYAFDNAIAYINNGRAKNARLPRVRIYDALYTDDVEVKLYDWEHKTWINPNEYTVTLNTTTLFEPYGGNQQETDVQYTITITPTDSTFSSRKVFVYFVYKKSDIYDEIQDGFKGDDNNGIHIMFKYAFTPGDMKKFDNVYEDISIRKHYDTNESYRFSDYLVDENKYIISRIRRSGKYPFVSDVRWSDAKIKTGETEYTLDDFDVYYEFPYPNVSTPQVLESVSYSTSLIADIDDATDGDIVTLVCMSNANGVVSDGSVSSALFLARINIVNENLTVDILDSTIGITEGTYRCFVAKDQSYKSCGGIIRVVSTIQRTDVVLDDTGHWYKVTNDVENRIIPNKFMIIPHESVTVTDTTTFEIHNNYELNTESDTSAYTYFYDTKYHVRYPMSNILLNDPSERLYINQGDNPTVEKIKSNYMGICRYSLQRIPVNGFIDLTGYIATPLTRSNYEFWVNGRCLNNTKNLVILSPTTIQLTNLTSLRNFEVIELVHDVNDSSLRPHGPVYADLYGNKFGSYIDAMLSNKAIRYQSIKYKFGTNIQTGLDKYANDIISNPNNNDLEKDIMSLLSSDVDADVYTKAETDALLRSLEDSFVGMTSSDIESYWDYGDIIVGSTNNATQETINSNAISEEVTSYVQLYNIPSINDVPLRHPTIEDLGMKEIPGSEIIRKYNKVWAAEITGRKGFPFTNMDLLVTSERVRLHVKMMDGQYRIYTTGICNRYFTIYISDTREGTPIQVIPMIQLGTSILLPQSYIGKWIRCTFPNTEPIQIQPLL